jgi:hypothetical protein
MRGAIIYDSDDVRCEERSDPMISEPTDAAPELTRTPLKKGKSDMEYRRLGNSGLMVRRIAIG